MSNSATEKKILSFALVKLKRLGFIGVTYQTLLKDEVYRSFLIEMLKDISLKNKKWEKPIHSILEKMGETR